MLISLIRSHLRNFEPYSSARSLHQKGVFFDANENSFGSVVSANADADLNRYPDPNALELRKALGKFLNISKKNIFVGNGSDEIIDLLIRLFVEADEEIIVMEPTYGMYTVAAKIAGVVVKNCLLTSDFQVDVPRLLLQINSKTKMIFCCSPNNPTGTLMKSEDIEILCEKFDGIVVVDEAYIEFASQPSLAEQVIRFENLIVLRTFSKAWGLAGIRVGYAIARELIVEYLHRIKLPYNVNRISQKLAIQALGQYKKMLEFKTFILDERKKLEKDLIHLGFRVFPSEANFLLVFHQKSSEITIRLVNDSGIVVRDVSTKPLLNDCLRISVGMPEQNELLIQSLTRILLKER